MTQYDTFKPIWIYGFCFIVFGVLGVLMHFSLLQEEIYTIEFMYFVFALSFLYFFVGVAILSKRKWGYFCLKGSLYLLIFGVPIGTFIAIKMLKYIKKHDVKKYFEKSGVGSCKV